MDPRRVILECTPDWYEWRVYDADGELLASYRRVRVSGSTMETGAEEANSFEEDMEAWPDLYDALEGNFVGGDISSALKTYHHR